MKSQQLLTWLLIAAALILTLNLAAVSYPLYVILPLVKALYLIFTMMIYGFLVNRFFSFKKREEPIEFSTAFALGFMVTGFFFYLVSLFKILLPWVIILYYLAPLPCLWFLLKKHKRALMDTLQNFFQRPAKEYLVFLFPLIYALLPPSFYDSLAYHLGIPNLYLQNSGFIETPQLFYANTFIYYEISLIPAVFAGDLVPRLFHFLVGVILILSALDFGVERFKIKKRTILLLAIISMPMSIFLLTAVKNDLPCALLILLAVSSFLKNRKYLSAWFWGFAIGIKYTNIIPFAIFLLLYFIKERGIPVKQVVVFVLIIAGILTPLMVKNFIFTGNPVFPFFHQYFDNKLPYWDSSRFTLLEHDAKKLFYSFKDVIKFPFTLSFRELGSGGIVGPLFLMFLPFLVIKKEKRLFLLVFSLLVLLVGANFKLSIRVWAIAFIFLSIYAAIAYEFLTYKIMKVLFFIIIGLNVVGAFGLQEYLYGSYNLYSGKLGIEKYKTSVFPTYKAMAFVNEKTAKDSKILLVGEAKSYYLKRPYRVSSGYDFSILKKYLETSVTHPQFIAALRADGIDYIIFNNREFHRLQRDYHRLTPEEFTKALDFLKRLPPIFREEEPGVFVFKVI
ncbi:MAG: hypothetical protein JSV88_23830 [Candidatus Aminicenantes bacterium]|nr:MAG: hypothetical protein JSV88_23830 [Candidatus Aminicenantes bacterium]